MSLKHFDADKVRDVAVGLEGVFPNVAFLIVSPILLELFRLLAMRPLEMCFAAVCASSDVS